MHRLRHILRTCLVLVMIPLTLFSGRPAAGCVCSDGHFEPLCGGGACCATSTVTRVSQPGPCGCSKCCCGVRAPSHSGDKPACCGGYTSPSSVASGNGDEQQGCCHPLTLLPLMAEKVVTPELDAALMVLHHTDCVSWFPVVVEPPVRVYVVNSGPPRVRLDLLQRYLL